MVSRVAQCACGQLSVTTTDDPEIVGICHCTQCQARTGSAFSIHAFFPHARSTITGESSSFSREAQSGRNVTFHFCPVCGTTLYWLTELMPRSWGIAVGAFRDPLFPPPQVAVWAEQKLHWVESPEWLPTKSRGAASA